MSLTRIVVTGASGNVGTGVLRALAAQLPQARVMGVCRRPPRSGAAPYDRVEWHPVDLGDPGAEEALGPALRGADAVVHLAWAIRPVRAEAQLHRANVDGTRALLRAVAAAGIDRVVVASSLGAYAPGAVVPVDERWPVSGQRSSTYSRHKAELEQLLDRFEREHPAVAVARIRPTLVVQREAAAEVRALYLGPLVPRPVLALLRRGAVPVLPLPSGIALQFVHADDVGDAVVRILQQRATGAFNLAADALGAGPLAALLGARPVAVVQAGVRSVVAGLFALRAVPVSPGWLDVALNTPLMDTSRARSVLGWRPRRTSTEGARELIDGLAEGAVGASPALGEPAPVAGSARVHDASLLAWTLLTVARAVRRRRAGRLDAAVVATNLVAGTPAALARLRDRRRDPVALLAPPAVAVAVLTTALASGGWAPVAATAVLNGLAAAERHRPYTTG